MIRPVVREHLEPSICLITLMNRSIVGENAGSLAMSDQPNKAFRAVALERAASLEGGPFVTRPSTATAKDREPRARPPEL